MQEEVEQKSLTLVVNTAKMTGRVFKAAILKYLAFRKEQQHSDQKGVKYRGKQSIKRLVTHSQSVTNIELNDSHIKEFERIARKYGVDYAIQKEKGTNKHLIFFKAKDADVINAALSEYATRREKKHERPSVLEALRKAKALVSNLTHDREKNKDRGAR